MFRAPAFRYLIIPGLAFLNFTLPATSTAAIPSRTIVAEPGKTYIAKTGDRFSLPGDGTYIFKWGKLSYRISINDCFVSGFDHWKWVPRFSVAQYEPSFTVIPSKADNAYSRGQALMASGKYGLATAKYKTVIRMVGNQGAGAVALEGLAAIQKEGLDLLNEAKRLYEAGEFAAARKLAQKGVDQFPDVYSGVRHAEKQPNIPKLFRDLISGIDGNLEVQSQMADSEAARREKNLYSLEYKAQKDDRAYLDLYHALEKIADRFPDSPTGRRCVERIKELRQDKRIYKIVQREKERRSIAAALQSADQYE